MNTQPDFEELLRLLEQNKVRYMIVGGYAVAFHGYPSFTKDIDIFFLNTKENIAKLRKALFAFGFADKDIPEETLSEQGNIIQFGVIPVRVDLLNEIDGVSYEEAEQHIIRGKYGDIQTNFIGRLELIKNKKASGRLKDKADAETLEDSQPDE